MKKATVIRTIILIITLINLILDTFGKSPLPITDETVSNIVSSIAVVISSVISWWYNNSFTKNAIKADKYFNQLKGNKNEQN